MTLSCCKATSHPWDRWQVEQRWMPDPLRCLIIAENPGDVTSEYFYQPPVDPHRDQVRVRNGLLHGLHDAGLLTQPTLEAFRDAGFLLDHAIRCPYLHPWSIKSGRRPVGTRASECLILFILYPP